MERFVAKQNGMPATMAATFGAPCAASFCATPAEMVEKNVKIVDTAKAVSLFVCLTFSIYTFPVISVLLLAIVGIAMVFLIDLRVRTLEILLCLLPIIGMIVTIVYPLLSKPTCDMFSSKPLRKISGAV